MIMVCLAEMGESDFLAKTLSLFVIDDDKLLVGRGVDVELKSFSDKERLHPHGHLDGMFGELEVEIIGEQRHKLQANKRALRYHGTVLFLDGEEMFVGFAVCEDHCLATEGTDFRTTDIEHVAVAGQIRQGDIVALSHQAVA